jgi:2-(3-amino-3-carboxypropyl)histidine synthase
MEEDRAIADLGPEIPDTSVDGEVATVEKKPKRRFIGRRAADAKAAARAQENGGGAGIEDSGAVQGAAFTQSPWEIDKLTVYQLHLVAAPPAP